MKQREKWIDNLRDEADRAGPPFSPLLHARIMGQIETVRERPTGRVGWTPGLRRLSVAATVLFAGVSVAIMLRHVPPHPSTIGRAPTLPSISIPSASVPEPLEQSFTDARYAYLDRDARDAVRYVARQIDVLPMSR